MLVGSALNKIERLTHEMQEFARHEQWDALTKAENLRQQLLVTINANTLSASQHLEQLNRISRENRIIEQLVKNRRDEIEVLLDAIGEQPEKAY